MLRNIFILAIEVHFLGSQLSADKQWLRLPTKTGDVSTAPARPKDTNEGARDAHLSPKNIILFSGAAPVLGKTYFTRAKKTETSNSQLKTHRRPKKHIIPEKHLMR